MADNLDRFYKYQERRAQSGYKAAILVKEQNAEKYSLLIASETVPSVFGTQDSFDFDLLNSPVKGKVAGKESLDDKEVEFLLHRDNIWRLHQLKDKVLDFLYFTPDCMGWKFTGTIKYRPNDAEADILRGTYTITPMSADPTEIFDCRDLVEETLCFADVIPDVVEKTDKLDLTLVQGTVVSPTYKWFKIKADGTKDSETALTEKDESNLYSIPEGAEGLIGITASADGYAPWTTTIYVNKAA